jgi:hypothetical protein
MDKHPDQGDAMRILTISRAVPLKSVAMTLISMLATGCAWLHHAQVGEVDATSSMALRPFELKVSETGVSFDEAGKVMKALNGSKVGRKDIDDAMAIIQLFQQGPRTGNPVFTETYAQNIVHDLYKECPTGKITGLISIRETRKYPVISGEIVKIKGYCAIARNSQKN